MGGVYLRKFGNYLYALVVILFLLLTVFMVFGVGSGGNTDEMESSLGTYLVCSTVSSRYADFLSSSGGDVLDEYIQEVAWFSDGVDKWSDAGKVISRSNLMRRREPEVGEVYETGVASWYGDKFHGRTTASGERYNMNDLTAAHKTLPFGTRVQVECLNTGKTVTVRINDRGPFIGGRIIDLSRASAGRIDLINRGIGRVNIRIVKE